MLGQRRQTDFSGELTAEEQPLRSELFSGDQLEQYGETLGKHHSIPTAGGSDLLLPRLAENRSLLVHVCGLLMQAVNTDRPITPAGEWLLDNFYLIEEQIRLAQSHLPKSYSWELPRLSSGASAGLFPSTFPTMGRDASKIDLPARMDLASDCSNPPNQLPIVTFPQIE